MTTAHGDVETPAFMPVGTQGAVKGVTHRDLENLGADIQAELGSDIAMVFDECLAYPSDLATTRQSMERTVRWARRARARLLALREGAVGAVAVTNRGQAQFGIVQGGIYPDLREESA